MTFNIELNGGPSRHTKGAVVDYMAFIIDGSEVVYAEEEWTDGVEDEEVEQFRVFWALLEKFVPAILDYPADPNSIGISWDHYGSPTEHFAKLEDAPEALQPYIEKFYR